MRAALPFITVTLLALSHSLITSACQPPFTNYSGHCAYVEEATPVNFCQAGQLCLDIGGELVIDLEVMRAISPSLGIIVWIGVTDLTEERGRMRDGWRLSNGSLFEPDSSDWQGPNPLNQATDDDFLTITSTGLVDLRFGYSPVGFACQPLVTPNSSHFARVDFLKLGDISPIYCSTEKTGIHQKFSCVAECARRWQCRAVLHNSAQGRCLMLDFADSSVGDAIETDPQWKKFVKVYKYQL